MRRCIFFTMMLFLKFCYAGEVIPINNFDVNKYLGLWYEVARLPNWFESNCVAPITANYSINPEYQDQILVINKCNRKDKDPNIASGVAYFVESQNIGKLEVSFLPKWLRWLPFGYGDYWIISTDYDSFAVVASPDHEYLWILSRTPQMPQEKILYTIKIAQDQGFNVSRLIFTTN